MNQYEDLSDSEEDTTQADDTNHEEQSKDVEMDSHDAQRILFYKKRMNIDMNECCICHQRLDMDKSGSYEDVIVVPCKIFKSCLYGI